MTKEEALSKIVPKDCWWEDMRNFTNVPEKYIHEAMELYSQQQAKAECIAFLGWIIRAGFEVDFEDGFVKIPNEGDPPHFTPVLNREQLFNLYIQSKQQTP